MKRLLLPALGILPGLAALCLLFPSIVKAEDLPSEDEALAVLQQTGADEAAFFEKGAACRRLAVIGTEKSVPALIALLETEQLDTEARTALENIDPAVVAPRLREALSQAQGRKRLHLLRTLGTLRDAESIDGIALLVRDADQKTAAAALTALGRIGTPRSEPVLRESLDSENETLSQTAADAILDLCGQILDTKDEKRYENAVSLAELLRTKAKLPEQYRKAADRILVLASGAKGANILLELLASDRQEDFTAALGVAREYEGNSRFVTMYADFLPKLAVERQGLALRILEDRPDARPLPETVLDLARKGAPETKRAALAVIARHGDRRCIPILLEALAGSDAEQIAAAKKALSRLEGNEVEAALVREIDGDRPELRLAAISLVGQRRIEQARDRILALATDSSQSADLRNAAIDSLGFVANAELLPKLVELLDRAGSDAEKNAWRKTLENAGTRMTDREQGVGILWSAANRASEETRIVVLEMMPVVGGEAALKLLIAEGKGPSAQRQDAATKALGEWTGAEAGEPLLDLTRTLKEARNERLHLRTLRGLIRILRQFDQPGERRLELARRARSLADRPEEQQRLDEVIARWTPKDMALFDGKTFQGWDGDTEHSFRIEAGAIVGGNLKERIPRNEFLTTKKIYRNFILTLECKAIGEDCNGGIQIRSRRIPEHHEMIGYQADMDRSGAIWGNLYDESRRNRNLAEPNREELMTVFKKDDWNRYEIRCEGKRIRLFVNGLQTVDYAEPDDSIEQEGLIGLQIHAGPPSETWYRNIRIEELQ